MSKNSRRAFAGLLVAILGFTAWAVSVRGRKPDGQNSPVDAPEFSGVTADMGRSTNLLAVGTWSEPVTDDAGYTLRGRLLVFDTPHYIETNRATGIGREWWGNAPVYLELQNLSARDDGALAVYFDLQDGLECQVTHANGQTMAPALQGWIVGPSMPWTLQYWVMVPVGGSVRLRADPMLGGFSPRPNGIVIQFSLGSRWIIPVGESDAYRLCGNFSPPTNHPSPPGTHVWSGVIDLPSLALRSPNP